MKRLLVLFFVTFAAVLAAAPDGSEKPNLLTNSSFEDGQAGWKFSSWASQGKFAIDTTVSHDGKASLRIDNVVGDDSFPRQTIAVKPNTRYRMSGFIKTRDVIVQGTGATLALEGGFVKSRSVSGNQDWIKVSFEFESGMRDSVNVGPRLGHHGSMATGTAWFDELTLVEIPSPVPPTVDSLRLGGAKSGRDIYPRWSVAGEWRGTHPDWSDIVTIRDDGTMEIARQASTGRWTLTAEGGTPMLVFRWDRFGTESLTMVGPDHLRGKTRNGRYFDLRRGEERTAAVER